METKLTTHDHSAAFAQAFFIGNLLFVGPFYLALWVLFILRYSKTSDVGRCHLKQALLASSLSTSLFLMINLGIILTGGYASLTALLSLEIYFMIIVPAFLFVGILAFISAVKGRAYSFPLVGTCLSTKEGLTPP